MTLALPMMALVKRELISTLRRTRSFVFLLVFTAGMIVFVLSLWPREDMPLSWVANNSAFLLGSVLWTAQLACYVLIPALAASSIVEEKETRSLDMLRMTLISPTGIVLAKLINAAGFMLLLVVAALPVLGAVLFLVGVDWVEIMHSFLNLIARACECAAVGIMCSTYYRTTYRAVVNAYGCLFIFWIFESMTSSWMLYVLAPAGRGRVPYDVVEYLRMAVPWAVTALCLLVAVLKLRRASRGEQYETRRPIDKPSELAARRLRFPFYLIDPLKRKKLIEDGRNPVYVRELRWGQICGTKTMVRVGYTALLIFGSFALFGGLAHSFGTQTRSVGGILLIHMIFMAIIGPLSLAGAFTKERENDTLDTLRMTLLTPDQLVTAKLYAGLAALSPVVGASLITSLPLALYIGLDQETLVDLITGYVSLGVCVLLSVGVGLLSSVMTKRTTIATVLSYGMALLCFIGFYAGAAWFDAAFGLGARFVAGCSPLFAYGAYLYDRSGLSALILDWVANVLVFALLGYSLIAAARKQFSARLRREE